MANKNIQYVKAGVSSLDLPGVLADQLTLFQPGGQVMPT
jgi:hypothetical protein